MYYSSLRKPVWLPPREAVSRPGPLATPGAASGRCDQHPNQLSKQFLPIRCVLVNTVLSILLHFPPGNLTVLRTLHGCPTEPLSWKAQNEIRWNTSRHMAATHSLSSMRLCYEPKLPALAQTDPRLTPLTAVTAIIRCYPEGLSALPS